MLFLGFFDFLFLVCCWFMMNVLGISGFRLNVVLGYVSAMCFGWFQNEQLLPPP